MLRLLQEQEIAIGWSRAHMGRDIPGGRGLLYVIPYFLLGSLQGSVP